MSITTGRKSNQRMTDNMTDPFEAVDERVDAIEAVRAMELESLREYIRYIRDSYLDGPGRVPTREERDEVRHVLREQIPSLEEYMEGRDT